MPVFAKYSPDRDETLFRRNSCAASDATDWLLPQSGFQRITIGLREPVTEGKRHQSLASRYVVTRDKARRDRTWNTGCGDKGNAAAADALAVGRA